ncbi:MAG: hypothetical protein CME60_04665 [Halobacteriovoraceae bacterium]|nr:hypothetical protein [Halobacteriovoraceae bacterium]
MPNNKNDKSGKKKLFLTDHKQKELEGFEEVLDLIDNNGVEVKTRKKEAQIEDYEIYDFLEKEVSRLEKLDQFFSVQMPLEKKYPQTKGLIQREMVELHLLKEEIIENSSESFSGLTHFLDHLIRSTR